MKHSIALLLLLFALVGSAAQAQMPVTVFAAASLRGALEDIAAVSGSDITLSFGGSGTIARQVAAGAPCDIVILASTQWMEWLAQKAGIAPADQRPIAQNTLVVIAPAGTPPLSSAQDLPARLGEGRLAMGQRDAVPAGSYARQWLQASQLWDRLQAQLAETDNVRAALVLVARGQSPYGIVYATDARAEPRVSVIWSIPDNSHDPVVYPAAALTPEGRAFLDHLSGPEARKILRMHGFSPVAP